MMHEITWYSLLEEMLTYYEAQRRMFSRNMNAVEPREGFEIPWEEADVKMNMIKCEMQRARYGGNGNA